MDPRPSNKFPPTRPPHVPWTLRRYSDTALRPRSVAAPLERLLARRN